MIKFLSSKLPLRLSRRDILFVSVCAVSSVIMSATWSQWWQLAWSNERYSYLLLIPLLSAGMIYRGRDQIFRSKEHAAGGTLLIIAGIISWCVAHWFFPESGLIDRFTLTVFGSVTLWVGSFRSLYDRQAWNEARFPILFLYLMVPVPAVVLHSVTVGLQVGSAAVTAWLLSLSNIPYFREGMIFRFPDLAVEVAEECSGIRSSITLLLWVALQAHFTLRSGWRKLLLLISVFPVVLFKNGLRIATLSVLTIKVDRRFMTGWLHHKGGFVFFGIALLIEIVVCRLLERSERTKPETQACNLIPESASPVGAGD